MSVDAAGTARFAEMFHELHPRVFAYALRHSDDATAQDVVSETFLIAWRRRSELPPNPLPWLLVVARNTLANQRRGQWRRDRLAACIGQLDRVAGAASGADDALVERQTMLTALAELTALERESLLLVAWDGLTTRDAARVAGCSVRAFEVRLSRARARLARAITATSPASLRKVLP
jgi:RNA polymerase sigma-70 factor (ECF subfamily)